MKKEEKYEFLNHLEVNDIVFTYNKKALFSKLAWWVDSEKGVDEDVKISHALIIFNKDLVAEARLSQGYVLLRDVKKYKESTHKIRVCRLVKPELKNFNAFKLRQKILQDVGDKKYSLIKLILIGIKRFFGIRKYTEIDDDAVICSEWVSEVFKAAGVDLYKGLKNHETSPISLFGSNKIQLIYTGK